MASKDSFAPSWYIALTNVGGSSGAHAAQPVSNHRAVRSHRLDHGIGRLEQVALTGRAVGAMPEEQRNVGLVPELPVRDAVAVSLHHFGREGGVGGRVDGRGAEVASRRPG